MKLFKLLTVLLLVPFACSTGVIITENAPGELWLDNRGMHINAHGGGMLYQNRVYYWYGEHKDETSNAANVGINC